MTSPSIVRVRASSSRLSSDRADADPDVDRLRGLIHRTEASFTILRVARHDLRRYDVWRRGDEVGIVPHRDDPEEVVPCGSASGSAGALLLLELLSDTATVPVPVGAGGLRQFADVVDLVRQVTSGGGTPERATVLHAHALDTDLVRVSGPGLWWGSARSGEALELQPAGDASYWAALFGMLRPSA